MRNKDLILQISHFTPYKPTEEQLLAIELLSDFLLSKEQRTLLLFNGYAGTGKTSLMGATVKALKALHHQTILLAPTGRAAKVFSSYAGESAYTIHHKIYRQKRFSPGESHFELMDNRHRHTLFIVDEASMISNQASGSDLFGSGRLLDDLIQYIYAGVSCKLILMGDIAQLPPVSQHNSVALDADQLRGYDLRVDEIALSGVARQEQASGILYNATLIRDALSQQLTDQFPTLHLRPFKDITKVQGDELIESLSSAYQRDGIDETMIICRSNKRANIYNQGVRSRIFYYEESLSSGERLMVVKNNYFWGEKKEGASPFLANGEIMEVIRVGRHHEMYGFHFCDLLVRFQSDGEERSLRIILDGLLSEQAALPPERQEELFRQIHDDYRDIPIQKQRLEKIKADPFFNAVQVKYAYCVTCHKAQGGQWRNIFLDIGYISEEMLGEAFYRWLYTAITRTTGELFLINLPPSFEGEAS